MKWIMTFMALILVGGGLPILWFKAWNEFDALPLGKKVLVGLLMVLVHVSAVVMVMVCRIGWMIEKDIRDVRRGLKEE